MKYTNRGKPGNAHRARSHRDLPNVELIEPRLLLSTYTVNTISDAPNPGPGLLSLRQAVAAANAHAGADTINFAPGLLPPGKLFTITLANGQITFSDTTG